MNIPSWIVMAIVFFLFRLLTGANKPVNQQRGKSTFDREATGPVPVNTNRPPVRSLKDELREAFREIEQSFEPPKQSNRGSNPPEKIQGNQVAQTDLLKEEIATNRENLNPRRPDLPKINTKINSTSTVAVSNNSTQKLAFNFNADAVLNGVIMSEVLGKPKSRQTPRRLY